MSPEHLDVLIVGAGLSGIGAGYHLQANCPGKSYAILEARDCIGGTWDLFRYPGIRSDSDMHRISEKIRFHHRVLRAEWSSTDARWTVEVWRSDTEETVHVSCSFLLMCSGYYRYDEGYTPELPGSERFEGRIVHPQHWTDDIDYAGKRAIVIGSGATAVTLVPAMAKDAAHVTMLQRSPSYVVSLPARRPDRQLPAARAAIQARIPARALEERRADDAQLPAQPPQTRPGQGAAPQRRREAPPCRLRHRHAFQTALSPVGAAPVPRARRGPIRGDLRGPGLSGHRPDRDVHR
jgi:cation diffusion facilitator CzcD-associated flavoprotein CzcO